MDVKANNLEKKIDWIIAALAFLVSYILFFPIYQAPGKFMFGLSGDSLKNYFTVSYYVRYDSGSLFTGMNYPYGEVVTYTDNQPLLSWILRALNEILPVGDNVVGIQNTLLILAPVISAWLLGLILKSLGVRGGIRIIGALLIAYMAPQIYRMAGHYGLAYSWIIPAIWYLCIRYAASKKPWKWLGGVVLLIISCGLLHPYNAVLLVVFTLSYSLLRWFSMRGPRLLWLATASLGALFLFMIIQGSIDPFEGRPKFPWGTFSYNASVEGILVPSAGPIHAFFASAFGTGEIEFERRLYVGLFVWIVLLSAFFRLLIALPGIIRRKRLPGLNTSIRILWWQALLVFLIASGTAHQMGLQSLQEIIPAIAQFRSLARIGWIIYYLLTVYAVYWIFLWYRLLSIRRLKTTGIFCLAIITIVWSYEACKYVQAVNAVITYENTLFEPKDSSWHTFLNQHNVDSHDFQAAMIVPVFLSGSEKMDRGRGNWLMRDACQLSFQTGMPLINIVMSRTPVEYTTSYMELYAPEYIRKRRVKDFNNKSILLLSLPYDQLLPEEKRLVDSATLLGQFNELSIYTLKTDALQAFSLPDICSDRPDISSTTDSSEIREAKDLPAFYEDFTSYAADTTYIGKGALRLRGKNKENHLFEIASLQSPDTSVLYEAHIWIYIDPQVPVMPEIYLDEYIHRDQLLTRTPFTVPEIPLVHGRWVRSSAPFRVDREDKRIHVWAKGAGHLLDELIIRPEGVLDCTRTPDGVIRYDNIRIDNPNQ